MFLFLFLSVGTTLGEGSVFRIHNPSDLIGFSNNVNSGTNYAGTTVFLESDIDLSGLSFDPIGKDKTFYFTGTFDGQGHTIANIAVNSSSRYIGLFGYSTGLAIRNVVVGGSSSFVSSYYESEYVNIGGIIGHCSASKNPCIIENSVNMANVTFEESNDKSHLGGIAGYLSSSSSYDSIMKNCVNYGFIRHSGDGLSSSVGGIVGKSEGPLEDDEGQKIYIQNCLNYGNIFVNASGEWSTFNIGGIAGSGSGNVIENCMSLGKIVSSLIYSPIGSIVGSAAHMSLYNCFWTSNVGYNDSYIEESPTSVDNETSLVELNSSVVEKLNKYTSNKSSWNSWLLNTNNATVSFTINDKEWYSLNSQIILLPDPVASSSSGGYSFSGWYNDKLLTSPFTAAEVTSDTVLYGMMCGSNYTVTLDVNGGNSSSFPSLHRMVIECDGFYGDLPNATREGHSFLGWFTEKEGGSEVKSGDQVMNLNDHSLYAHWGEDSTCYVRIVFGKKDMTEEEVKEIIEKYTNEEFTIVKFEGDEADVTVILMFNSVEGAHELIEKIKRSSTVKEIDFSLEAFEWKSYSPHYLPVLLSSLVIL